MSPVADPALDRLRQARENRSIAIQFAKKHNVKLTISTSAHYWVFEIPERGKHGRVEWWPETARLVFFGKYKRPVEATTLRNVCREIQSRIVVDPPTGSERE